MARIGPVREEGKGVTRSGVPRYAQTSVASNVMWDLRSGVDDVSAGDGTIKAFLTLKRIAVVGVSRMPTEAANVIYRKLRTSGYEVFPVNPKAGEIEGDRCYPDIGSIPVGVEGVVIVTPAEAAAEVVEQCREAHVGYVWMHRAVGRGSVSGVAVELCKEYGMQVIVGGCPMLICEPVDLGHRCLRWYLKITGRLSGSPKDRQAA